MAKRPTGVFKKTNEYQQLLDPAFYENCPKSVLAAIAVSYALHFKNAELNNVTEVLRDEWEVLHTNGLVPQSPPKK